MSCLSAKFTRGSTSLRLPGSPACQLQSGLPSYKHLHYFIFKTSRRLTLHPVACYFRVSFDAPSIQTCHQSDTLTTNLHPSSRPQHGLQSWYGLTFHLFLVDSPELTQCRGFGDGPGWLHCHPLQEGGHVRSHIYSHLPSIIYHSC